jgi:hypothetical protein
LAIVAFYRQPSRRRRAPHTKEERDMRVTPTGAAVMLVLILAGCATAPPPIRLRNPQTGQTFTCSGEAASGHRWWDENAKRTRDNCVRELEGQGYEVVK